MVRRASGWKNGGLIRRLGRDVAGNMLAIVAAALIPLTAMIGSGVDMARAYTVQARLQQACDAASLAGRRAMTANTIDSNVTGETTKFFNFNFPQGMYGTAAFTPQVTSPASGTVHIVASTTVPTAVMQLFGYRAIPVAVDCDASQNFINADVMLVLDVTGSMNCPPSTQNSDCGGNEQSGSKIQALRDAVMALYDQLKPTQDFLIANGYRIRYGIVPYSQTVNVGALLYAANPANIRDPGIYTQVDYGNISCTASNRSGCTDYYVGMKRVSVTHGSAWLGDRTKWAGCIEERQTLATAGTAPTAAELADPQMKDLNIDLAATSDVNSQWQPYDPSSQTLGGSSGTCPTAARALQIFTSRGDLLGYVNSLDPTGSTYHDIGMIWGARMLSSAGVFAASPVSYNGMRTNRYVIFLTDGEMAPTYTDYNAYGTEMCDHRVTGGGQCSGIHSSQVPAPDQNLIDRHNGRFLAACNAVRNRPAQVWVIALATALTDQLKACNGNNPDQYATVSNSADLIAKFKQIGQDISELRLSQ